MKKRTVGLTWLTALAGLLALSSCDSTTSSGIGTVRLHLVASGSPSFASAAEQTDFGDITSATVTISHVELMPGHVTIDLGAYEVTLNLLDMEGDVTRLLGSAPALGGYEQLRLIVSDVTVTLADGSELPARVPSGPRTGIKVDFAGPVTVGGRRSSGPRGASAPSRSRPRRCTGRRAGAPPA